MALSPDICLRKCLDFSDKRKEFSCYYLPSTAFTKLTGIGNASSGTQQCYMIYDQMKMENYTENNSVNSPNNNNCYWAIPLILISFLLIGLIMLQK